MFELCPGWQRTSQQLRSRAAPERFMDQPKEAWLRGHVVLPPPLLLPLPSTPLRNHRYHDLFALSQAEAVAFIVVAHTHDRTHTRPHTHTAAHTHTRPHTHANSRTHTHTAAPRTHTAAHTYTHGRTHIHTRPRTHTRAHTHGRLFSLSLSLSSPFTHTSHTHFVHARSHIYTDTHNTLTSVRK